MNITAPCATKPLVDPLGNSRLGPGGDIPPLGFNGQYSTVAGFKTFKEGYTFEARWNIADLITAGIMQTGRVYRVQFMVHDGDQNKLRSDCEQWPGWLRGRYPQPSQSGPHNA